MPEIRIIDNTTRPAGDELLASLEQAADVRIATAFATGAGVSRLVDPFKRVLSSGGALQVVYGLDFRITNPEAMDAFRSLADEYPDSVKHLAYPKWDLHVSQTFHPKLYICTTASGDARVLLGSSNLTTGGLWENFEANAVIEGMANEAVIQEAHGVFGRAVAQKMCITPTQESIEAYRELHRRAATRPFTPTPPDDLLPAYEQIENLARPASADCSQHAGQHNSVNRVPLDDRMARLPDNQSGAGRHKCPYCAYNEGAQQARADIRASRSSEIPRPSEQSANADCLAHAGRGSRGDRAPLDDRMTRLPDNQSGEGRHKCPYCAYAHGYWETVDSRR